MLPTVKPLGRATAIAACTAALAGCPLERAPKPEVSAADSPPLAVVPAPQAFALTPLPRKDLS
jgi:hypothetical protein